jgi:outer membrane protein assembly factor BamB
MNNKNLHFKLNNQFMRQVPKNFISEYFILWSFAFILLHPFPLSAQEANWTHFRGSNLNGISAEPVEPIIWNDTTNIVWKTGIAGEGLSSPVIYGDQIWLATATEEGKKLYGVCISYLTGKEIYKIKIFEPEKVYSIHMMNSYASPTPCIEAGFVYFNFGSYGTACLRTSDGSVVWKRTDLKCNHAQGPASSPIIYKNLLILHFEGIDIQYIVALNKETGKTVWMKDRPKECYAKLENTGKKAYVTPIIINVSGKDLLISNGSAVCNAYNPETGAEVWRIVQGENSTVSMPIFENGSLYFFTGSVNPPSGEKYAELLAVDPKGSGNITGSHVLWRFRTKDEQVVSPLIKDGLIYTIDAMGWLFCLDSKTGQVVYSKKLSGHYLASPIYAAGNIYLNSLNGSTLVIKEGRTLKIVATNKLSDVNIYATPAFLRNSIIIRAGSWLYRIGNKTL